MLTKTLFSALPFFICLVWSTVFFLDYRKNNPAKRMLAWLLLACVGLHLSRVMRIYGNGPDFDLVRCLYIFFTLAIYPLAYLYVRRLTALKPMRKREFWVLVPALLVCLAAVAAYRFSSISPRGVIIFEHILMPIEAVLLGFYAPRGIREFRRDIANYYSDRSGHKMRLFARFILAFTVFSVAKSCVLAFDVDLSSETWVVITISSIYAVFSFMLGYLGQQINFTADEMRLDILREDDLMRQNFSCDDVDDQENMAGRAPCGNMPPLEEKRINDGIRYAMEENRLFLKPNLKITDLARELCSNRTYVSDCLNHNFGMSFSDYVNCQRVEYAKQMIESDPDLCIDVVSAESGFTSGSAFYRNFRKFTGMTPNDYRHRVQE